MKVVKMHHLILQTESKKPIEKKLVETDVTVLLPYGVPGIQVLQLKPKNHPQNNHQLQSLKKNPKDPTPNKLTHSFVLMTPINTLSVEGGEGFSNIR